MLCSLQDSGNVGTIIRTAVGLSLNGVIITNDTCDMHSQKVIRASMGAIFKIPVYSISDEIKAITKLNEDFNTYCAVLSENSQDVRKVIFSENSVVAIGNEGNGLSEKVIEKCAQKINIPMNENVESLNAAMAAGILIWEMSK